jgi:hypothetical protein
MQFTPEQQDEIQRAKAASEKRVHLRHTAEQRNEWRAAVEEELACKDENIANIRKIRAAAEQPGFFGDVRRAIILSRRPLDELAMDIEVDPLLLSDFRAGDADLPAAALDRLLKRLGLRLMQEIPRS